ncbi:hypothetical protein AALO_G00160480, partial [Alosa alosa]
LIVYARFGERELLAAADQLGSCDGTVFSGTRLPKCPTSALLQTNTLTGRGGKSFLFLLSLVSAPVLWCTSKARSCACAPALAVFVFIFRCGRLEGCRCLGRTGLGVCWTCASWWLCWRRAARVSTWSAGSPARPATGDSTSSSSWTSLEVYSFIWNDILLC